MNSEEKLSLQARKKRKGVSQIELQHHNDEKMEKWTESQSRGGSNSIRIGN